MDFRQKTVLITGGSSGIGLGTAIVDGISHRRFLIVPSAESSFYHWLDGFLGGLPYRIMGFLVERAALRRARSQKSNQRKMNRPWHGFPGA